MMVAKLGIGKSPSVGILASYFHIQTMEIVTGKYHLRQIFLDHWKAFKAEHPEMVRTEVEEEVQKMLACRDPKKMGFAVYTCKKHPHEKTRVPHSCKSRFCNTCGKVQTDRWIASCHKLLPNTDYYHLTFTIPEQLRGLFQSEWVLQDALFRASADVLLSFFKGERRITPAITSVKHTFGRDMKWNPHIHTILSCGGLDENGQWKAIDFIPSNMLKQRWKVKLLNLIKQRIRHTLRQNPQHSSLKIFHVAEVFKNFFLDLYSLSWYVYLSAKLINVKSTIEYVGRYTKRPVIAETRILEYNGQWIKFQYLDHKSGEQTTWEMPIFKFMARLIAHIPPKGHRNIHHYGLVANRVSAQFKPILQTLFGKVQQTMDKLSWRQRQTYYRGYDPLRCIRCGADMIFLFRTFFSKQKNAFVICYS